MPTTQELLHELGLGPSWVTAVEVELEAAGVRRTSDVWDSALVRGWVNRTVADGDLLTARQYRAVAMRLNRFPPPVIRQRAETAMGRAEIERCGLTIALRYTHDYAPMVVGRAGHRLVRQGLADGRRDLPPAAAARARELWEAGATRQEMAAQFELGPAALARVVAQLPERLTSGAVSSRFGWSADNIFQRLDRGTFPSPDGVEGHRQWWWATTVQAWEDQQELAQCPQCPARVRRMSAHARAHDSPSSTTGAS